MAEKKKRSTKTAGRATSAAEPSAGRDACAKRASARNSEDQKARAAKDVKPAPIPDYGPENLVDPDDSGDEIFALCGPAGIRRSG